MTDRAAILAAYDIVEAPPEDPTVSELTEICEVAAALLDVPSAVVNLFDERLQHGVAAWGAEPQATPAEDSLCLLSLTSEQNVVVDDAGADPRFADSPWVDGRIASVRFFCSLLLRTPDGLPIGALCAFDTVPRDVDSSRLHAVTLLAQRVVDVLELRLRTAQLAKRNEELTRSQDRLASFAGQISHDLKAPITAILGFTELLADMEAIADDPGASGFLARCTSAARRMLGMIDDLLAYARVGATHAAAPVALDAVMPEVLADLGALAAEADVSWSGPEVVADPTALRALLRNLINNSITYRGTGRATVAVLSEHVAESIVLRVVDHGPGIPAESRDEVLRPLVRLRKDIPGAGLGLAVAVRIAAAHGGSLRLSETPGGGITASVLLPR